MLMYKLKPIEAKKKRVCSTCYTKGAVKPDCHKCHGTGVINSKTIRYNVAVHPIEIVKVDRDPKTGIIRYWENQSEFFYETVVPELNKYVPEVPFGIHLLHKNYDSAFTEANRVNKALEELEVKANKEFIKKPWYVQTREEPKVEEEELCDKLEALLNDDNIDFFALRELHKAMINRQVILE